MIARNRTQTEIIIYFQKYKAIYPIQVSEGLGIGITKAKEYFKACRKEYRKVSKEFVHAIDTDFFLNWYKQK